MELRSRFYFAPAIAATVSAAFIKPLSFWASRNHHKFNSFFDDGFAGSKRDSIGIVSMIVPGFHVDWTNGYGPLTRGAITITSIRFVLLLVLYQVIEQILAGSV